MGGSGKNEKETWSVTRLLPWPPWFTGNSRVLPTGRPSPPTSVRSAFGPGPYQPGVRRTL
jgi:hypothetical protein